jgi:DNA polymerase I-like protein with 3'-5' exonuclease and polymerase domains
MVRCSPDALGVVVLDLSQIEIRVNAHYTHLIGHPDEVLDNVLFHGGDMHSITAASAFHSAEYAKDPQKAIELVQKNERNAAKSLNFAMQYGGSMNAISTHPVLGKLPHDVQNNLHKAFKTTRSGTIAYQD